MPSKIEDFVSAISRDEADLKVAIRIREEENAEYVTGEKDMTETIETHSEIETTY